jgi:hypothetical protein
MTAYYLRRNNTVKGMEIYAGKVFPIKMSRGFDCNLEIRKPFDSEISNLITKSDAIFVISGEFKPNNKTKLVLEALLEGKRNPINQKANNSDDMLIREGANNTLAFQPNYYAEFVKAINLEFTTIQLNTIKSLRWRYFRKGPVDMLKQGRIQCSLDNINWTFIPDLDVTCQVSYISSTSLNVSGLEISDFNEINSNEEPIHHELIREAIEQIRTSPRAALIIGISALEIAVKQVMINLTTNAEWLITNTPSPNILKIIKHYFPLLIINYDNCKIEQTILNRIEDGISARNELIHRGSIPPRITSIYEILEAIYRVIWFCDYYCGHEWAIEHARGEISIPNLL